MTKYLHLIVFGLLVGGWVAPARVKADISIDGAPESDASATPADGTSTTHKISHHKKKKSSTAATASTGSAAGSEEVQKKTASTGTTAAPSTTPVPAGSGTDLAGTGKPATKGSRKKHHAKGEAATTTAGTATPPAEEKKGTTAGSASGSGSPAPAPVTGAAATATTAAKAETTEKPVAVKSSRRKRHGKSETAKTAAGAGTSTATAGSSAPLSPAAGGTQNAGTASPSAATAPSVPAKLPPSGATAPAPAAASPPATTGVPPPAVAKSTHRRHHGKAATPSSPGPVIVVTPSSVPLTQQPPSLSASGGNSPITVPAPISLGPTVSTGLPIARPGAGTTATLPGLTPSVRLDTRPGQIGQSSPGLGATPGRSYSLAGTSKFSYTDYPPVRRRPTQTYPWKTDIITTVFWIGEAGSTVSSTTNYQSAWNANWIHDNSGSDDQDDMSGYASSLHASTLNPFYIALPFNDLVYPDKARRWIPSSWFKPPRDGKAVSACQNRWVEIKNKATGRYCFAQWEDVGPLRYDHAEYVFGPERPDTLTHAGLDVSPAVALYLGIDRHGSAITSWRFVDDEDVQPGMWLKYDEQAILLRAIKEQTRRGATQRLQDLSEPTQDDNAQDANQKKAGAARG